MTKKKEYPEIEPHWLNQLQAARSLDISTRAFVAWNVKPVARVGRQAFYTMRDILDNRLEHQSENLKAAYDSTDGDGLEHERLRLTRAQADNMEIKNSIAKGKTAPIEIIQVVLSRVAGEIAGELDSVPLNIRRKHPDLQNQIIEDIKRHCVKGQNAIARCDEILDDALDDYISESDPA